MRDCVEHTQSTSRYGSTTWQGRRVGMHVKAYCLRHGLDSSDVRGKVVMHTCDNPRCINPDHLTLGDNSTNMLDMYAKGRQGFDRSHDTRTKVRGEAHGQCVLTDEQVTAMRARRAYGVPLRTLAKEFNMSYGQTQRICAGEVR